MPATAGPGDKQSSNRPASIAPFAITFRPTDRAGVATCHNGFPELTPFGSQFKLNGYAWAGGTSNLPPIAAMAIPTFTKCGKVWKAGWRRALDSTMTPLSEEASSMAPRSSTASAASRK
jgi:hypothetical protein